MAALVQAARDAVCLAVAGAGLADALDCRTVQLPAAGMPAGVFVFDGPEVLAAAAVPHRGPLRRSGRAAVGGQLLERGGAWSWRRHGAAVDAAGRLGQADPNRPLSTGQIPFLAAQLSKRRFDLTLDDLPVLGLQLLEDLDAWSLAAARRPRAGRRRTGRRRPACPCRPPTVRARERRAGTDRRRWRASGDWLDPISPAIPTRRKCSNGWNVSTIWSMRRSADRPSAMEELQAAWPKVWPRIGRGPADRVAGAVFAVCPVGVGGMRRRGRHPQSNSGHSGPGRALSAVWRRARDRPGCAHRPCGGNGPGGPRRGFWSPAASRGLAVWPRNGIPRTHDRFSGIRYSRRAPRKTVSSASPPASDHGVQEQPTPRLPVPARTAATAAHGRNPC